jgi:CBS domain-containing protein
MSDLKVKDLMTRTVVTVEPRDSVSEAARRLAGNRISAAPVIEAGAVIGVLSEADILSALAPSPGRRRPVVQHPAGTGWMRSNHHRTEPPTVRETMSSPAITISPEASVWEAASTMKRHSVKRLPVTTGEGRLLGMLSRADLIRAVARNDESIRADVVHCLQVLHGASALVDVDVEGGKVILSGRGPDADTIRAAGEMAARVPGVVAMENLVVEEPSEIRITHQDLTGLDPIAGPRANGS